MMIGYARTSTAEQKAGLEAQERELTALGCDRVFAEQVSGSQVQRPKLQAALDYAREGDTFVVTRPDRLARSTRDLLDIAEGLKAKGVRLRILSMDVDTGTPTGELMLTLLAGIATFERALMLERQREGIAKAKAEGKYKGRKPTVSNRADEIKALRDEGLSMGEIAKKLQVGKGSVHRALSQSA